MANLSKVIGKNNFWNFFGIVILPGFFMEMAKIYMRMNRSFKYLSFEGWMKLLGQKLEKLFNFY